MLPIFRLEECHRTNNEGILDNLGRMVGSGIDAFEFRNSSCFQIIDGGDENGDLDILGKLVSSLVGSGLDKSQLVILSPLNRYLGNINYYCSKLFNGDKPAQVVNNVKFRIGDRVIMMHNNYKFNLMNGSERVLLKGLMTRLWRSTLVARCFCL